jgi:hypothetical protein
LYVFASPGFAGNLSSPQKSLVLARWEAVGISADF